MKIKKLPIKLYASIKAVITLFLNLPGDDRIKHVVRRIESLNEDETNECINIILQNFANRHRHISDIFLHHFDKLERLYPGSMSHFSLEKKTLLGAFFTKEYSIQSAALFNPSIVPHPDQEGLNPNEQRFVMSLRATGEGHISSIVFQTGIIKETGDITLDRPAEYYCPLQKNVNAVYNKNFIHCRLAANPGANTAIMNFLPDSFTESQAKNILKSITNPDPSTITSITLLEEIMDINYELENSSHLPINEKVIFPIAKGEIMGMEDVRFVKFEGHGQSNYYGTYTAYDGKRIKTQLIETPDFTKFKIRSLYGLAVNDKGMALFPEKVNGKFAMISRQGGENIYIMFSDDLYHWEKFHLLMEPQYDWELVQIGNCGSPLKTDNGWLLLTHGVGAMRTYVISAVLLDLHNPTRIIGRLTKPLLVADAGEREGYVPNVVYTCGCILHGDLLIIPYAVSDSATSFATITLDEVLNDMKL